MLAAFLVRGRIVPAEVSWLQDVPAWLVVILAATPGAAGVALAMLTERPVPGRTALAVLGQLLMALAVLHLIAVLPGSRTSQRPLDARDALLSGQLGLALGFGALAGCVGPIVDNQLPGYGAAPPARRAGPPSGRRGVTRAHVVGVAAGAAVLLAAGAVVLLA